MFCDEWCKVAAEEEFGDEVRIMERWWKGRLDGIEWCRSASDGGERKRRRRERDEKTDCDAQMLKGRKQCFQLKL